MSFDAICAFQYTLFHLIALISHPVWPFAYFFKRTKAQNASWDKIDALNKKRQNLEQLILASMKMVEIHTTNLCSEMNAMLEGRIEEVEQRSTEGA